MRVRDSGPATHGRELGGIRQLHWSGAFPKDIVFGVYSLVESRGAEEAPGKTLKEPYMNQRNREQLEGVLGDLAEVIAHGDYQRIANLCKRDDQTQYTSDYVRKVLLGMRTNKAILNKAKKYLIRQRRTQEALQTTS